MYDRYVSKPWHLLLSVCLLFLGAVTICYDGWFWFSLAVGWLGFLSGIWVILAGYWQAYGNYWREVTAFAEAMLANKNPDVWAALGFKYPVKKFKTEVSDAPKDSPYRTTEYFDLPGSQAAFTSLADGVLMGRSLSEAEWVRNKTYSSPTFRELKKELEKRKLITLKVVGSPKQGYVLTRKGNDFFLGHASPSIKLLADSRNMEAPAAPPTPRLSPTHE